MKRQIVPSYKILKFVNSPAGNQFDLVMRYKVFFFTDSCWLGIDFKESN